MDIITVGEKNYNVEDLTEAAKTLITDIRKVEIELESATRQLSIFLYAKNSLVDRLSAEIANIPDIQLPQESSES